MKITTLLASSLVVVALTGCASSGTDAPAAPAATAASAAKPATAPAATAAPNAPKDAVTTTLNASLTRAHDAAVEAAKQSGFEIATTSTDTFVTGPRPRKIGLVVGSGGETINIALKSLSDSSTQVTVWTKRTFVGGAGQKDWDAPVIAAMKASLGG